MTSQLRDVADTTATIAVSGLRKLYDRQLAVDGLSFTLQAGEVCGLVGPNGAGKTTTLRCIAGLLPATEGLIHVAGYDAATEPLELKRRLAYVPDDPPLFDDLTVQQHLDLIGQIYRVTNAQDKAAELLDWFELSEKADAGATTLSRGMRQKLAIACASLFEPQVLLLDEPLTGLDPPGIRRLLELVGRRAAAGTIVIISSHLLAMIENVCTQLLVMERGQAKYFGAKASLRAQYPAAKSLEEAFFAATCSGTAVPTINPFPASVDVLPTGSLV